MRYYSGPINMTRYRGGRIYGRSLRLHGGKFNFWEFLKKIGSWIQTGIDKAAPFTSKLVGPVVKATTGISVPNPSDIGLNSDTLGAVTDIMKKVGDTDAGNQMLTKLRSAMGKGLVLH